MIFTGQSPDKKYTAEEIEDIIRNNVSPIWLGEEYNHNPKFSVEQFLIFVFVNELNTYYIKPVVRLSGTANETQCEGTKRRSMVDMYKLCLYYYPELSFKTFLSEFIKLCGAENRPLVIGGRWCKEVGRMVFRKKMSLGFGYEVSGKKSGIRNDVFINEFGYQGLPEMVKEMLNQELVLTNTVHYSYTYW